MDRDRQGSVGMGQDQGRGAVGAKWAVRHGWASDTHTMSKDPADAFVAWLVGGCRWRDGWLERNTVYLPELGTLIQRHLLTEQ